MLSASFLPAYFSTIDAEVAELLEFGETEGEEEKEQNEKEKKFDYLLNHSHCNAWTYLNTQAFHTPTEQWQTYCIDITTPPPEQA